MSAIKKTYQRPPSSSRLVLITGASSGIGAATAAQLTRDGWRVWGTSRQTHSSIGEDPIQWLPMDVGDEDSVNRGAAQVLEQEGRLEAVVCNAGFGIFGSVEEVSTADAQAQFDTNFFGVLRVLRAVLPGMHEAKAGRVILMGSLRRRARLQTRTQRHTPAPRLAQPLPHPTALQAGLTGTTCEPPGSRVGEPRDEVTGLELQRSFSPEDNMKASVQESRLVTVGLLVLLIASCTSVPKRNPLPTELANSASVSGIEGARVWGDEMPSYADAFFAQSREEVLQNWSAWHGEQLNFLAISGGGAGGAFGAGLLAGWTEAGDRPEFQMVTGISTGALTAPFAFLGPDYDHVLKEIYTNYSTADLLKKRSPFNAFTSDAMYSTDKFQELIAKYFNEEILAALEVEARKGRVLSIGTTNLDVGRPVVWRISAIATSNHPDRLNLIRQIILASASIPAAFPPVAIDVVANGEHYDEIHVDGGTASQVFLYPTALNLPRFLEKLESPMNPTVFVIRNSRLDPSAAIVNRKLLPIASHSISTLIRSQGVGDLYRIFALAERDHLDFNLAFIPADFKDIPNELFDAQWMQKLFDLGYKLGQAGYPWKDAPPDFREDQDQ